jgi:hypothetical protein
MCLGQAVLLPKKDFNRSPEEKPIGFAGGDGRAALAEEKKSPARGGASIFRNAGA